MLHSISMMRSFSGLSVDRAALGRPELASGQKAHLRAWQARARAEGWALHLESPLHWQPLRQIRPAAQALHPGLAACCSMPANLLDLRRPIEVLHSIEGR